MHLLGTATKIYYAPNMSSATAHRAPSNEQGAYTSAHRRIMRFQRLAPAVVMAAALVLQAPATQAFAPAALGAPRHLRDLAPRVARAPQNAAPTCVISQDPETLVRLVGKSVVTQFREIGLKTTGFLRGGNIPAHEQAMKSSGDLEKWLECHANCDLTQWGSGKAKSPMHLLKELKQGESFLRADGTRAVKVAKVRVFDGDYELVEVAQILGGMLEVDGTVTGGLLKDRKGRHLAEKFKPGETPLQACGRGVTV